MRGNMEAAIPHLLHEFMTGQKPTAVAAVDRRYFRMIFWSLLVFMTTLGLYAWYAPIAARVAASEHAARAKVVIYVDANMSDDGTR